GIYADINLTTQCSFVIKDALIHECEAITNDSLSYSQSGFGGGIFLGGSGDYNPISKLIDFRGMKIYNNSADKYGQSLFVVMTKVAELCKYGILGEYMKGNYSDAYSDEHDLIGIPMNLTEFNSSSPQTIEQQQKPLELLWGILGILKSAQVTVNVSNPNGKLIFHIEGKRMISGQLNVKIFEFRNKIQEAIDQEQKVINYQYNKNNLKSLKGTSTQSPFTSKHKSVNQQQISISTNLKIKQKRLLDLANEFIYPPEDGPSIPIQIEAEIPNDQTASFGMNDYKWLNYKQNIYAVLISNGRKIFTGNDGLTIEEDQNAAVPLEVTIEEEDVDDDKKDDPEKEDEDEKEDDPEKEGEQEQHEKKDKGLPIGIIVGIVVGALAIVFVIIIIIIVSIVISKKFFVFIRSQFLEKIKKIGKGAFGTVWKMKKIKGQRIVAIKEVDYDSDEEKQRFHKEVSVMRDVYHILQQASSSSSQLPFIHVVEPLGYFLNEDKDKAYLVLEYCENGDLRQYIQNMKNLGTVITDAKAFEIIKQVTLALNQLHMNGIIHGDIKPENILLTEHFQVKLSDFGLTRKLQEGRGYTTNHGGTTYYLAPELLHSQSARGKRMQTIAADIWAFGILLFELLAQKHPFFNSDDIELSPLEIYNRIIDEEPADLPDHYSQNLKKLIRQMLIK
ncbi:MAG: putative serine threonine-protein kinase nek2, partial [Streblomastix strix]